MRPQDVRELLGRVASGELSVAEASDRLRTLPYERTASAHVDHHRHLRTGSPEVIFGAGKTSAQIVEIAMALLGNGSNVMCTRCSEDDFAAVCGALEHAGLGVRPEAATYHASARAFTVERTAPEVLGTVGVIAAGTSDLPVADEAAVAARFLGAEVSRLIDVGVAGIHRLLDQRAALEAPDVLVVVAGMEGALPSVVAGLVSTPVIAVPTSVGYGASFGGVAALLGMLNACASGITVVNIDNGFGAAAAAHRILHHRRAAATAAR